MRIHILGICGTFMGGVALLAKALGHEVSGADQQVYPPMSTQLAAAGIALTEGYQAESLPTEVDRIVVGNTMRRGHPVVERMLDLGLPWTSGPQWLAEQVLPGRQVLAVAGTHGKTTTASMLAHCLDRAGLQPGFLIGGVPLDFGLSARLGDPQAPFVVEADEYDTAFFDKRSKFVHYRPRTLILGNLEFDHADIFADLAQIQQQCHHLIRTIPGAGRILVPAADPAIEAVLAMGCWTPVEFFAVDGAADWSVQVLTADGSRWRLLHRGRLYGPLSWRHGGRHNLANAAAAVAAAATLGVDPAQSLAALADFQGVRRRMEWRGESAGVTVYDDFAHHPTAIATTLAGLRARLDPGQRILALLEPRSNTMRRGVHAADLAPALAAADWVGVLDPGQLSWSLREALAPLGARAGVFPGVADLIAAVVAQARPGDQVLVMSNGGFENVHQRLLDALAGEAGGV